MDYSTFTDEQLQAEQHALAAEQELRRQRDEIPQQVAGLAKVFEDCGGDPDVLIEAINKIVEAEGDTEADRG